MPSIAIFWPSAPHRLLRNTVVNEWEKAGRPGTGKRPGEGDIVAHSKTLGEIVRYRPLMPTTDVEGDIEALPLWAGQGVGLVRTVMSAAEIMDEIHAEACSILKRLAAKAS